MQKLYYSPFANHHPQWLKFLFILIFFGTIFLTCSFTFTYFDNQLGFIGIPIGFVGGYYIAYYGLYGLYVNFSNTSMDKLYDKLEKKEEDKRSMEYMKKLQEMSKKIKNKDNKK